MSKSADGLGICRECKHLQKYDYPDHVEIGSDIYEKASCLRSSDVYRLCKHVRISLNKCTFFNTSKKSSLQSLYDLIIAFFKSIKCNSWEPLKKAVDSELQDYR